MGVRPENQGGKPVLDFDPVPRDLVLQEPDGFRDEHGQVAIDNVRHMHGGVIEQLGDRPADPLQSLPQHLQVSIPLLRGEGPRYERVNTVHRSRQGAVDLVGDSRRQCAHRRHFLGSRKQLLCSFPLGLFLRKPVHHHPVAVLEIAQLVVSLREGDGLELSEANGVQGAHQAPDRPRHHPRRRKHEEDHHGGGGNGQGERFPLELEQTVREPGEGVAEPEGAEPLRGDVQRRGHVDHSSGERISDVGEDDSIGRKGLPRQGVVERPVEQGQVAVRQDPALGVEHHGIVDVEVLAADHAGNVQIQEPRLGYDFRFLVEKDLGEGEFHRRGQRFRRLLLLLQHVPLLRFHEEIVQGDRNEEDPHRPGGHEFAGEGRGGESQFAKKGLEVWQRIPHPVGMEAIFLYRKSYSSPRAGTKPC